MTFHINVSFDVSGPFRVVQSSMVWPNKAYSLSPSPLPPPRKAEKSDVMKALSPVLEIEVSISF